MKDQKTGGKEYPESPWWPLDCKAGCVYRAHDGGCNYVFMEDELRGCDPGRECTRYRNKRKKQNKSPVILPGTVKHLGLRRTQPGGCSWDNVRGYELYQAGMSQTQIARELGTTKTAVWARKREHWVYGRP